MKKIHLTILLFIGSFNLISQTPNDYVDKGVENIRNNKIHQSILNFNKAIELDSNSIAAHFHRGYAHYIDGNYSNAIDDFTKVILNESDFKEEAYFARGLAHMEDPRENRALNANFVAAISDFDLAIDIDSAFADAYYERGVCKYFINDKDGAVEDYSKTIKLDQNYLNAYYNRGILYYSWKFWESAIKDFNKTIKIDPKHVGAYNLRGEAKMKSGNFDSAKKDFEKAIELDSIFSDPLCNLGILKLTIGDENEGCMDLKKAMDLNNKKAEEMFDEYCK